MTGWNDMLALAERELELVRGGDLEALPDAIAERARLAATLSAAPAAARPVVERLVAVQEQIVVELMLARAGLVRELGALRRGRGAMRGYAGTAAPRASLVDGSA